MWKYLKQEKGLIILGLITCISSVYFNMKSQLLKGQVLNSALQAKLFGSESPLVLLIINLVIAICLAFLYGLIRSRLAVNCSSRLRKDFFSSFLNRSYSAHKKHSEGQVFALYSQQIASIEIDYFMTLGVLAQMLTTLAFALTTLYLLQSTLGLAYLALISLPIFIPPLFRKVIVRAAEAQVKSLNTFTGLTSSYLKSFELIKNMQIESRIGSLFKQSVEDLQHYEYNLEAKKAMGSGLNFLASLLGQLGTCLLAAYLVLKKQLSPGDFITVTGITMTCSIPLYWIAQHWQSIQASRPSRRAILAYLARQDEHLGQDAEPDLNQEEIPEIELVDLSFSYSDAEPLIKNLNLLLKPGSKTLITGPSGSGKSSLTKLLLGQLKPTSGQIKLKGNLVSNYPDLSPVIGISFQEASLFSDSIWQNLSLGNPEIKPDQLESLLSSLGLAKWANQQGLSYQVKNQGENLSGGEKKRLGLARSLARLTPVLILDEPLANIDPANISLVEDLISKLDSRTLIVVSHQGSDHFQQSFDQIVEFKGGGQINVRSN